MNFLPKNIDWVSIKQVSSSPSFSYREILIATHKHSYEDWYIMMGWIEPIDDYKNFKIMCKRAGLSKSYDDFEVPLDEILSIGLFRSYGYVNENN